MKLNRTYKALSNEDLNRLEDGLGLVFPKSYRTFLLAHNGGAPTRRIIKSRTRFYNIHLFYSVASKEDVSLSAQIGTMRKALASNIIPIGLTGQGCLCLSLDDGAIYHWDSSLDLGFGVGVQKLDFLADDMETLLGSLEGEEEPYINDAISNVGRRADIATLDEFLERGGDINAQSSEDATIVKYAAYGGQLDFVRKCADKGAILHGRGLLHAALLKGHAHLVEYLLEMGVDPNERDAFGRTPLDEVLDEDNSLAVQMVKAKGGFGTI